MAIRRVLPTGVATGGSGADYAANACGTINEASAAATDTYLLASPDTAFTGLTFACAKGTAATPNRYLNVATGALSSFGALIADCLSTSGWVANGAGDVGLSYLVATMTKNGTGNKMKLTFDGTPQANTMQAYCPVANLSLAAFQNVCSWMQDYVGTCPANSLVIKLCTGNDGATGVVATMTWAEAMAALSVNTPVCLNNGAALANGINSIAIYTGAVAPAASSVWAFDTFYATIAGFDLNSVLHKSFNYRGAAWAPNTVIALNEIRVPTFGARSPLVYKCAFAGTTGATEYFTDADGDSKPIWDKAILPVMGDFAAQRVTDNDVIWEVLGDDEAYYFWAIKSLDFTYGAGKGRIEIDNHCGNVGNAGRGYYGTDETVAMSYLTPYLYPMAAAATTVMDSVGASGTDAVPRTISGGYNTSDVVVGVTFISGRNGLGYGLSLNSKTKVKITGGLGFVRHGYGLIGPAAVFSWYSVKGVIVVSPTTYGINISATAQALIIMQWCSVINTGSASIVCSITTYRNTFGFRSIGSLSPYAPIVFENEGTVVDWCAYNGAGYGAYASNVIMVNYRSSYNAVASLTAWNKSVGRIKNGSYGESTIVIGRLGETTAHYGDGVKIQNFGGVIGDNRVYYCNMGQATYNSTTHVWTIAVNSVNATARIPLRHKVGVISCRVANVPYTVSLIVNPTNTNLVAQLKILGNTIAGVSYDLYSQSSGSGPQTLTITFTPLETGPVEIYLDCYITNTTLTYTLAYDLDDLSATASGQTMQINSIGSELFGDEQVNAGQNTAETVTTVVV